MKNRIEFIHVFYLAVIVSLIFTFVCIIETSIKRAMIFDHGDSYELVIAGQSLIYDK